MDVLPVASNSAQKIAKNISSQMQQANANTEYVLAIVRVMLVPVQICVAVIAWFLKKANLGIAIPTMDIVFVKTSKYNLSSEIFSIIVYFYIIRWREDINKWLRVLCE